jgi:hypothetical protein
MSRSNFAAVLCGALMAVPLFTGPAGATCAWVLWYKPWPGGRIERTSYEVESAYETLAKCDEMRLTLQSGGTGPMICLPDTIDPRSPKRSGR